MAVKFLSGLDIYGSIDLQKNELKNAVMHSLALAPSNPVEGQMYWDSSQSGGKKLYIYDADGAAWIDITGDLTSLSSGAKNTIHVSGGSGGDVTVELDHLGIEDLSAPTGDGIIFWDSSALSNAGTTAWLTMDTASGIRFIGTELQLYQIPNSSLANDSVTVTKGNGLTSTSGGTMALGESVTITVGEGAGIAVEANAVALKNHAGLTDNTVTKWDDTNGQLINTSITDDGTDVTVSTNLIVGGDLTVQGSLTSLETTNTAITDNVIVLNSGETGAGISSITSGIEIERGTEGNKTFVYHETNGRWELSGKLQVSDVPVVTSGIGSIYIQDTTPADAGVIKKMSYADFRAGLGVSNMSLSLEASSGTQPANTLWVTKAGNTYTVSHYMGTKFLIAQVFSSATGETVHVDTARTSDDVITITFGGAVTDGDYYLVLQATDFVSHGDGGNIQDGGGGQIGG